MDRTDMIRPEPPTTSQGDPPLHLAPTRWLALVLSIGVGVVLVQAALDLSDAPDGLTGQVAERMDVSGVEHPVTAVLLNFRGYDTFLEIAVLTLAALGVLAVRRDRDLRSARWMSWSRLHDDPVMVWLVPILVPLLVLAAGFLLWLGTSAPGGAFQAAALLAGAGVILRMTGRPTVAALQSGTFRVVLLSGFIVFLAVALVTMVFNDNLLQLPRAGTSLVLILIELALTVSIAVILVSLYVGGEPPDSGERNAAE